MSLILDGTNGVSDIDGSASTPAIRGTDANTGIFFGTDVIGFSEGGAESMRINSSGNVGIGTSSPASRLDVRTSSAEIGRFSSSATNGGYQIFYPDNVTTPVYVGSQKAILATGNATDFAIVGTGANNMVFGTNGAERVRITSGGDLLVGTTTAQGRLTITGSTSDATAYTLTTEAADGTDQLRVRCDGAVYMGLDGSSPYNLTNGAAANAVLLSDGFLYRSTSSLRYKKEIQDATHGLAEVLTLRPVTYKGTSSSDGENIYGGFIAEEVHAVGLTEFVQYDNDGQPDALHYGNMVSLMAKAIQELNAKVQTLEAQNAAFEARLAALEGV